MMGDENWEYKIASNGIGKSYGFELLVKKSQGKWNGFIGYTFSKTTREYPLVNQGKEFLFDYDRPHSLSLFASYKVTPKLSLSLTWTYQTGQPYTPALGRQLTISQDGELTDALIYGEKNSARMRDYHRMDFALNYEKTGKRGNKVIWTFSVYNLYCRQNPNQYYYNHDKTSERYSYEIEPLNLYQISLFPIIPSFSYKVFFQQRPKREKVKRDVNEKFRKWLYHE